MRLKMANKLLDGSYACGICGAKYPSSTRADQCRDEHDILYIPMTREEFNLLLHAIAFDDIGTIPDSLRKTLEKYQRANFK